MTRRIFNFDEQVRFARLSGDYNPIHIDAVAARRFLFGQPIVHGIHALLWALHVWLCDQQGPVRLSRLNVLFRSPIHLGEPIEFRIRHKASGFVQLDATAYGADLLTATVGWQSGTDGGISINPELPERSACRQWSPNKDQPPAGEVPLQLNRASAAELFPAAARCLPEEQLAVLLATTRLVGMEAPGLNSIYNCLDLTAKERAHGDKQSLYYQTESYDERFSLLTLRVKAPGFQGWLSAVRRPAPATQASFVEMRQRVNGQEFCGQRALVIGGSRGLGEVAVKALCAGNAVVKFSYHRGAEEAQVIAAEVAAGGGTAVCFAYDVLKDSDQLVRQTDDWSPTILCYLATPFVFSSIQGRFVQSLFDRLSDTYIEGFLRTFHALLVPGNSLRDVLYPSSTAIDELLPNMGEYAAAKSAAETLCRFLERMHPNIRFHYPRLPRMATDQTVSLLPTESADARDVVLSLLRGICTPSRVDKPKNQ
jgi:NAD(P)-dependent dehydrogenase (short-subunit alcohol dehydrogenase family)